MLDPTREVLVSSACGARVFEDDETPAVFYALPIRPGLAVEGGQPVLRLLVIRQRAERVTTPIRGTLSLTTQFALTPGQLDQIAAEMVQRLGQGPTQSAPAPVIAPVDWERGDVRVRLLPQAWAELHGTPSLVGRNECALSAAFGPDQVRALTDAWHAGLPDARISYDLVARASSSASESAHAEARTGGSPSWQSSLNVSLHARQARDWPVRAEGPFGVPSALVAGALQELDL